MASEIKVDTISEKTSANGVTIDGVSLKDSKVATANSIDSDTYVDGSIDTVHIADNQVTLAKMAGLVRGKIIYGDSSGDPAALTVGSNGQALVSDGTDISWGSAGATLTGSTNNTVVTVTGSSAIAGEAKLLFDPPKLTIGNATAEDTLIVFDGNAQDFHIGLDDSADSLTIGLGSTLGTTSHMVFDATGAITKPLQPAFLATDNDSDQSIDASATTVDFQTEIFDQNADFASNTFTAPVTGRYIFNYCFSFGSLSDAWTAVRFKTSNRNLGTIDDPTGTYEERTSCVIADMDANDTCVIEVDTDGDSSFEARAGRWFSGALLC